MATTVVPGKVSSPDRQTPMNSRIPIVQEEFGADTIARSPTTRISDMDRDELVRVIQNGHLPFLSHETCEHLPFHDRQTLERLANLAQRCCINRTTRTVNADGNTTHERQIFGA